MTEKEAKMKGYQYTGHYSRYKEEMKAKIQELKNLGFKAVLVPVKANPYSRGQNTGITGYSIYAEPALGISEALDNYTARVERQSFLMEDLLQKHKREVEELQKRFDEEIAKKAELEAQLDRR
jgi:hypothetical protein